ncbi:MAG: hypothetical protein V7604_2454, partial [Hyphomicrobiales bacterium]
DHMIKEHSCRSPELCTLKLGQAQQM